MTDEQPTAGIILVVDDDRAHARLTQIELEGAGYQVMVRQEARDIVELIATLRPSCCVLDLWLPAMSGLQMAELLQEDARTREVPLIACSMLDDQEARDAAARVGFASFVPKMQINNGLTAHAPEALLDAVRRVTRTERRQEEDRP